MKNEGEPNGRHSGPTLDAPAIVFGRYVVEELLVRGPTSSVYRGRQRSLGRAVAIKVLGGTHRRTTTAARRAFEREATFLARVRHPHVVTVLDYGELESGSLAMVQPMLRGPTLEALVARCGGLTPSRVVRLGRQLACALRRIHGLKAVHRDIKPANMIVEVDEMGEDQLKLLDFGLVLLASSASTPGFRTAMRRAVGSPHYVSPEQALGESVDGRSDIYSAGAALFFALTSKTPFEGDTVSQLVAQHIEAPPPDPREYAPAAPARLARVVMKCLEKLPADRFEHAEAFRSALAEAGADTGDHTALARPWWRGLSLSKRRAR